MLLPANLLKKWQGKDYFAEVLALEGELYRQHKNRRTLRFNCADKVYFAKIHQGVGWQEIFKNLLQGRMPIVSARPEWQAIHCLEKLKIPTLPLAGYGLRGKNPAKIQSFLITEEIKQAPSLEEFCSTWAKTPPALSLKRTLIKEIARIAALMHGHGLNHRDFYLCHFLLDLSQGKENLSANPLRLYVIDLHRAQIRQRVPLRWQIKDLGGLYFSCLQLGLQLTQHDLLRFMRAYCHYFPGVFVPTHEDFWQQVTQRALKMLAKEKSNNVSIEKKPHYFWCCDSAYLSADMLTLLRDPELALQKFAVQMLKEGDTTTVMKINMDNRAYVIKRYNTISFWHALKKMF